ncbi:MAG: hypothetical protein IIT82_06625, partial [Selenomonas sp.]|nr:hypothetical protein [Selenomonas sp.]
CQGAGTLSALGLIGALLGTTPLAVAPTSAASHGAAGRYVTGGAAAVLLLALFIEPLAAAWADFPAMTVPVLVGSGFLLILRLSREIPLAADENTRRAELMSITVMTLLLPLAHNFATALGAGIWGYIIFMVFAGRARDISRCMVAGGALFAFYFAYSMFI